MFFYKRTSKGARLLDLEPFARELRQALALELGEAAFEAGFLHRRGGGWDGGDRSFGTELLSFRRVQSSRISACRSLPRSRASRPAAGSSSASARRAATGEGAERARRLVGEHAVPPRTLPGGTGGAFASSKLSSFFLKKIPVAREIGNGDRPAGDVEDERARARGRGPSPSTDGEDHFGGGALPFSGEAPVERGRSFGARLRDAGLLLRGDRDEGVGARGERPGSSVSPLTHRQSKRRPADSSTPRTWIGASGDSGWNSVSAQWRFRKPKRLGERKLPGDPFQLGELAEHSCHLARVWNSSESSARSPGKPAASSSAEKWRAHSAGESGRVLVISKTCSKRLRRSGAGSASCDQLGQGDGAVGVLASRASSEARRADLGVGAAEEGRADEAARAGEFHRVESQLEQTQGEIDQRKDDKAGRARR